MNKYPICAMAALLLAVVPLCGCVKADAEPLSALFSDEPAPIDTSVYFDTSDLTYIGEREQEIVIGYEFENPEDNAPTITYYEYRSADGETFCFDEKGRLCSYTNTEDIFLNKVVKDDAPTLTTADVSLTAGEIFESCVGSNTAYEISNYGRPGDLLIKSTDSNAGSTCAIAEFNAYGDVRAFNVSYNTLESEVDYDYFEEKIQAYIDSVGERTEITDCEYTVRFEQLDDKIYALYTCTFTDDVGAVFCESAGFTKPVSQNDHEVS